MARYFLHLRDGTDELLDPDGVEFENIDALHQAVLTCARDVSAADAHKGLIDLRYRIDAEDGQGSVAYTLPFKDAVSVVT